jgi:hypothetical protein
MGGFASCRAKTHGPEPVDGSRAASWLGLNVRGLSRRMNSPRSDLLDELALVYVRTAVDAFLAQQGCCERRRDGLMYSGRLALINRRGFCAA